MLFRIKFWVYDFETLSLFFQNLLFIGCITFSQVMVIYLSWFLHPLHVLQGFNIYHLTFRGKSVRVLGRQIWNQLSKTLKAILSFQIFKSSLNDWGLDLNANAKLAVIWIIKARECYYVGSLILDLICLILVFYCKFCTFRIILFYIVSYLNFLSENK